MIRLIPLLLVVVVVVLLFRMLAPSLRSAVRRERTRHSTGRTPGGYAFDRRRDQLARRVKRVAPGPAERRDDIVAFLDSHTGVEAYMEPKTAMSAMSVVLVDADGEWRRFELAEDAFIRSIAAQRGIRVFDAATTGYPARMKRR